MSYANWARAVVIAGTLLAVGVIVCASVPVPRPRTVTGNTEPQSLKGEHERQTLDSGEIPLLPGQQMSTAPPDEEQSMNRQEPEVIVPGGPKNVLLWLRARNLNEPECREQAGLSPVISYWITEVGEDYSEPEVVDSHPGIYVYDNSQTWLIDEVKGRHAMPRCELFPQQIASRFRLRFLEPSNGLARYNVRHGRQELLLRAIPTILKDGTIEHGPSTVTVEKSLGPWLFVTRRFRVNGCHGFLPMERYQRDVVNVARARLQTRLLEQELHEPLGAAKRTAVELFRQDPHTAHLTNVPVHVGLVPFFSEPQVKIHAHFTQYVGRGNSDGKWEVNTRSQFVPLETLAGILKFYGRLPQVVRSFIAEENAPQCWMLGGYSVLPDDAFVNRH